MFRASTADGKFIIGLDMNYLERLMAGQPIEIDLRLIGGADVVTLMFAESFQKLETELEILTGAPLPMNPWPDIQ